MFFINNYNGGPEIILRQNSDIYTNFVSCTNKMINCYSSLSLNKDWHSKITHTEDEDCESRCDEDAEYKKEFIYINQEQDDK